MKCKECRVKIHNNQNDGLCPACFSEGGDFEDYLLDDANIEMFGDDALFLDDDMGDK